MSDNNQPKQIHINFKKIEQIFLLLMEITIIVGILTWLSSLIWPFENGYDILERIGLFYSFYQISTYIILSTLNDIKADEYLALKSNALLALKVCEYNDHKWKQILKNQINEQLSKRALNDLDIRQKYIVLEQYINANSKKDIEYLIIWAEHCAEENKLQWKLSYFSRKIK